MCEPQDPLIALREIPFKIASLEQATEPGSMNRSLVNSVYDSVRKDIEYVISYLESHGHTAKSVREEIYEKLRSSQHDH